MAKPRRPQDPVAPPAALDSLPLFSDSHVDDHPVSAGTTSGGTAAHRPRGGAIAASQTMATRLLATATPQPRERSSHGSHHDRPEPVPAVARRTPVPDAAGASAGIVEPEVADGPGASDDDGHQVSDGVDWALVRAFRQQAADQLATALQERDGLDEAARHELGRSIILDLLTGHADDALTAGSPTFDAHEQQQLATIVYDALFRLGRLQPLVDDPNVENVEINGYDNVTLVYSDGRIIAGPPIADSDAELIEALTFLAARSGDSERPFSPASPRLHLRLPGGHRLAATAWHSPRPQVVIRRHRLTDINLDDLVERDMLDAGMASFLRSAVRAKRSMVISGAQGAGKTTLLRALCNEIAAFERIGTIETEYELHLHEMLERHPRCFAWEARPGSGERGPDGKNIGEITLDDIVYDCWRFNLARIIVGEVRGREVIPMFQAMQAGAGSLSTTHANSARGAISRLVTCALEAGTHVTETFAHRQIAEHIDLIIYVTLDEGLTIDGQVDVGRRTRYVSEVIAVEAGENGHPAVTDVYQPGADGRAVPGTLPQWLIGLARYGFNIDQFRGQGAA